MNPRCSIRFPVFGFTVRVILARDIRRTGQRLRANLTDCVAAFVSDQEDGAWIVLGASPDEATVAHEASHAIRHMLKKHGARLDDETFAYHLDYLVGRIHKFLKGR